MCFIDFRCLSLHAKNENMTIELTDEQVKKFDEWKESFGKLPHIGSTGGHFGLEIIFTSIGQVIHGTNWKSDKIDLTEYENF